MKTQFKKSIALLLTVFILFLYVVYPPLAFAQEVTPTDTPTPTTTIDNSATVSTDTNTTSDTGDNDIYTTVTPTPTPTIDPSVSPTDTPTPTPTIDPSADLNASNSAQVDNNISSTANTGNNSATVTGDTDPSATPDASQTADNSDTSTSGQDQSGSNVCDSSIQTGNATSVTNVQNSVNTNLMNSNVVDQTLNIYVAQNGDLNLSDPLTLASDAITSHPNDPVINMTVTNVNNFAYVTNDITSVANSGGNSINGGGNATIATGNADSVVSLLNNINFTVVDSQIHVVTINIFGTLNGNIILPDPNTSLACSGCGVNLTANNAASVTNNVSSTANTGDNSVIASGSASIQTGNADSVVNSLNIVNTNLSGVNAEVLYVNDLGNWNGNFIGWGNLDPQAGGASLVLYNLSPSNANGSGSANIINNAVVTNNITSLANTGNNAISGGSGFIATGNAFSAISLLNFINTNFVNSFGFFGFLNIFGSWTGDIGGQSQFAALNANNSDAPPTSDTGTGNNSNATEEQGGQLSVTNTNNVGAFVYPGDTVTFTIKVKNTGTGKVYGTNLNLTLMHNGQNLGTASFSLGDIDAQQGVKVTTGIVLPKNSPGGLYTAIAQASGDVGPDNNSVSANGNSNFNVFNNITLAYNNPQTPHVTVLGAQTKTGKENFAAKSAQSPSYLLSLILILMTYVLIRGIRKRRYLVSLLSSPDFKESLSALRMFLF